MYNFTVWVNDERNMIAENGIEPVLRSIENSYGMTAPNLVKVTMRENETADSIGRGRMIFIISMWFTFRKCQLSKFGFSAFEIEKPRFLSDKVSPLQTRT